MLSDCTDVLKVRIKAPLEVRAQRVMTRENLRDLAAAEERISEDDKMHRKWVQTFYNRRWDDETNFDLILDTGALSMDAAVEEIITAAQAMQKEPSADPATTTAGLKVDPVLNDAISRVMVSPLPAFPDEK